MGKTVKRISYERFEDFEDRNRSYLRHKRIFLTNVPSVYDDLKTSIIQSNYDKFRELLKQEFIHSIEPLKTELPYTGGHHSRQYGHQSYISQPFLEALFFHHNAVFNLLVDLIVKEEDETFQEIFCKALNKTDIPKDICQGWTSEQADNIFNALEALNNYEPKTGLEEENRGREVKELYDHLVELVAARPISDKTYSDKVKWLSYKYEFLSVLHSKDEAFKNHLGYKRIIANIASLILTLGTANLINFAITGNFWFFNQTTSQSLVKKITDTFGEEEQLRGKKDIPAEEELLSDGENFQGDMSFYIM